MQEWRRHSQDCAVRSLPGSRLLTPDERAQVLYAFNEAPEVKPEVGLIQDAFLEHVKNHPDAVAVIFEEGQLTYAQLNHRANLIANALLARDVRPDDRVGLCLERSVQMIIGMLGVLKAGAGYVPLDPAYPADRLAYMIDDSSPKAVLTNALHTEKLLGHGRPLISLDQDPSSDGKNPIVTELNPRNLAYVIYTSGSTGRSKGVMIEHRSVLRLVKNTSCAPVSDSDCVAHCSSPSFDAATWEVWAPLLNGGRVLIVPQRTVMEPHALNRMLVHHGVTAAFLTVGLFHEYVDHLEEAFGGLRYLLTGGDVPNSTKLARVLKKPRPPKHLINAYGPTETTTFATAFEIATTDLPDGAPPIGRPISNTRVYILDNRRHPVPIGATGEIYIGGAGVARGYLNRPALTAERFSPSPFDGANARLYKSGDLGRWRADGNIEFIGRTDLQLKVRGFRVEPGEIEAALQNHTLVDQAVVVAQPDETGQKSLLAYVVLSSEHLEFQENSGEGAPASRLAEHRDEAKVLHTIAISNAIRTLTEFLTSRLPRYMVPARLVALDRLPLTPNGKVDRQRLPAPSTIPKVSQAIDKEHTPVEARLSETWARMFKLERVGIDDTFFDLGGHSILALRLSAEISRIFGKHIPTLAVYEHATIRSMAAFIESASIDSTATQPDGIETLNPLAPAERDLSLLISEEIPQRSGPISHEQSRFLSFMQSHPNRTLWITSQLRLRGAWNVALLERSLSIVVERHESLRSKILTIGNRTIQQALPTSNNFRLRTLDEPTASERDALHRAQQQIDMLLHQPANLAEDALLNVTLIRLSEDDFILAVAIHHIVCDAVSLTIFFRELWTSYADLLNSRSSSLTKIPLQYLDYSLWQREDANLSSARSERYWISRLHGATPLRMPADAVLPSERLSRRPASVDILFGKPLSDSMQELGRSAQTLPALVLLAAYAGLIFCRYNQADFVLPVAVSGRVSSSHVNVIGLFASSLPLRIQLDHSITFMSLLKSISQEFLSACSHHDFRGYRRHGVDLWDGTFFNWVGDVEELVGLPSQSERTDLGPSLEVDAFRRSAVEADEAFELTCQIHWGFESTCEGYHGRAYYRADRFTPGTMDGLVADLLKISEYMVRDPFAPVRSFRSS